MHFWWILGLGNPFFKVLVGQCHPGRLKSPPATIMALFILEACWANSVKADMIG